MCHSGTVRLVTSGIHHIENRKCPHADRRDHVGKVLRLSRQYVPLTPNAERLGRRYESADIKRYDALHLACAVEAQTDYFCTTDDRLLRKGGQVDTKSTKVVSPFDLVLQLPNQPEP